MLGFRFIERLSHEWSRQEQMTIKVEQHDFGTAVAPDILETTGLGPASVQP